MSIAFGNESIEYLERVTGWKFSDEDRAFLEYSRQDLAKVENPYRLHIFSDPLNISCGYHIYNKVKEMLKKYNKVSESNTVVHLSQSSLPEPKLSDAERDFIRLNELLMNLVRFSSYAKLKAEREENKKQLKLTLIELEQEFGTVTNAEMAIIRNAVKNNDLIKVEEDVEKLNLTFDGEFIFIWLHKPTKRRYIEKYLPGGRLLKGWITTKENFNGEFPKIVEGTLTSVSHEHEDGYRGKFQLVNGESDSFIGQVYEIIDDEARKEKYHLYGPENTDGLKKLKHWEEVTVNIADALVDRPADADIWSARWKNSLANR